MTELVISPMRSSGKWTWTDGTVVYEAFTHAKLLAEIAEGEGCEVRVKTQAEKQVLYRQGLYKPLHRMHEVVADLWSFGMDQGQISTELKMDPYEVHRIIMRAKNHKDPRVVSRARARCA